MCGGGGGVGLLSPRAVKLLRPPTLDSLPFENRQWFSLKTQGFLGLSCRPAHSSSLSSFFPSQHLWITSCMPGTMRGGAPLARNTAKLPAQLELELCRDQTAALSVASTGRPDDCRGWVRPTSPRWVRTENYTHLPCPTPGPSSFLTHKCVPTPPPSQHISRCINSPGPPRSSWKTLGWEPLPHPARALRTPRLPPALGNHMFLLQSLFS
jgi:hypothetical protein